MKSRSELWLLSRVLNQKARYDIAAKTFRVAYGTILVRLKVFLSFSVGVVTHMGQVTRGYTETVTNAAPHSEGQSNTSEHMFCTLITFFLK